MDRIIIDNERRTSLLHRPPPGGQKHRGRKEARARLGSGRDLPSKSKGSLGEWWGMVSQGH